MLPSSFQQVFSPIKGFRQIRFSAQIKQQLVFLPLPFPSPSSFHIFLLGTAPSLNLLKPGPFHGLLSLQVGCFHQAILLQSQHLAQFTVLLAISVCASIPGHESISSRKEKMPCHYSFVQVSIYSSLCGQVHCLVQALEHGVLQGPSAVSVLLQFLTRGSAGSSLFISVGQPPSLPTHHWGVLLCSAPWFIYVELCLPATAYYSLNTQPQSISESCQSLFSGITTLHSV